MPQTGETGSTPKIGTGMEAPCRNAAEMPASEVGRGNELATTGFVRPAPMPWRKNVITWPGATLTMFGRAYPAPITVAVLSAAASAEKAAHAIANVIRFISYLLRFQDRPHGR